MLTLNIIQRSCYHFHYSNTGLIQKERVDIDIEKGAQISVIRNYDTLYLLFIFSFLCLFYVTDLIKKLELRLLVTFIFNKA